MKQVFREVNPDIVHAHNIFSAKMAKEIGGYPIVYDNHEYWSKFVIFQYENSESNYEDRNSIEKIKRNITIFGNTIRSRKRKMWIEWEMDIVSELPTLVPSESIRAELSNTSRDVFVLPNFPLENEFESMGEPPYHEKISSVYAGTPAFRGYETPIKNIDGFIDLFNNNSIGQLNVIGWKSKDSEFVRYHGYLDRAEMFTEMSHNSLGFIPWKRHPFHPYCSPNKAYEYAHAGLVVFCTNSIRPIFDELKENVIGFDNYEVMIRKIKELITSPDVVYKKQLTTFQFARKNLLWEKHENKIFEAYNKA
jgi:glycosyltransferase involved in cell wall biosynthesis